MSHFGLVPFFPRWFDDIERTHTLFDQFFGQDLLDSDLMGPLNWYPGGLLRARMLPEGQAGPLRPSFDRARSGISRVINDKNEFKVCLDVQQFKPEEITVKTVSDSVVSQRPSSPLCPPTVSSASLLPSSRPWRLVARGLSPSPTPRTRPSLPAAKKKASSREEARARRWNPKRHRLA
jgi:hypothetical protein